MRKFVIFVVALAAVMVLYVTTCRSNQEPQEQPVLTQDTSVVDSTKQLADSTKVDSVD